MKNLRLQLQRNNPMRHLVIPLLLLLATPALAQDVMPPDEGGEELAEPEKPAPKKFEKPTPTPQATNAPAADEKPKQEYNTVILQGLNKVTGHTSKFNVLLGSTATFGNLQINLHRCWQASPEERPENAAMLEVREHKQGEGDVTLFIGWMFSSSPGLSALEHPVYDITVLSCAHTPDTKNPGDKPAPSPTPKQAHSGHNN